MLVFCLFFFSDTATTEIYTLSLHDALPISAVRASRAAPMKSGVPGASRMCRHLPAWSQWRTWVSMEKWWRCLHILDRKSTRLNSSHLGISYAVFCLKKKKIKEKHTVHKVNR